MPASNGLNGETQPSSNETNGTPRDSKGWDGKLRVDKRAIITNPEALSDPDYSDEDAPPVQQIEADEDLLEEYEEDTDDIDLVHCRISSIPALRLERFKKVQKLCLRQNAIANIEFPAQWDANKTLRDLDLYDNLLKHISGLDDLLELISLDLSFNKLKHIKNVNHLTKLKDLYFVQNRLSKIENLSGLPLLRNLELAANRIREIEGLEDLKGLEELWLGKNKITQIQNIGHLSNLKILSIQANRITEIGGISNLPNLEELYISHNALTSISGLESNTALRVLDISNNPIDHLSGLEQQSKLEEMWASYCKLDSFDEVEKQLKDKEALETVYLEGNPLQLRQMALYRNKVRLALPQVKQIDASKCAFSDERMH